ncbi:MAG: protein kinase [Myxococcota bacterium]|nr:protein kinase [Myxococcota bacterium]
MDKAEIASLKQQVAKLKTGEAVSFLYFYDKKSRSDLTKGRQLFIVDRSTFKAADLKRTRARALKVSAKPLIGTVDRSPSKQVRFFVTSPSHATVLSKGLKPIGAKVAPLKPARVLFCSEGSTAPLTIDSTAEIEATESEESEEIRLRAVAETSDRSALQAIVADGGPAGQAAAGKLRGLIEARIKKQLQERFKTLEWSGALDLKLRQLMDNFPAGDFSSSNDVLVAVRAAMVDGPVAGALSSAPPSDEQLRKRCGDSDAEAAADAQATLRARMAARISERLIAEARQVGESLSAEAALAMATLSVRDVDDFDDIADTIDELTGTLLARQIALTEALSEDTEEASEEDDEELPDLPGYLSEPLDVVRRRLAALAATATAVEDEPESAYSERLKIAEYIASTLSDEELTPPRDGVLYLIERIRDALVETTYPTVTPIILEQDVFSLPKLSGRLKALMEQAHALLQLNSEQVLLKEHRDTAYDTIKALEKHLSGADATLKPYVGLYIRNLNTHFFTASRHEKTGSVSAFFRNTVGAEVQERTLLELPSGSQLELWNKINPETGEEGSLGKGGFGYGRFGVLHDPETGESEATFVKKMRHSKENIEAQNAFIETQIKNTDRLELKAFLNEVDIMRRLEGSPNIVTLHDGIISRGSDGKEKMYLMMEMLPGGDVEGIIAKQEKRGAMGVEAKKMMVLQALTGLKDVHDKGIIHRDIKPENLMIDEDGVVKLVDFGTAAVTDDRGRMVSPDSTGTPGFRPPSIDYGGDVSKRPPVYVYTKANDIFAMKKTVEKLLAGVNLSDHADLRSFLDAFDREDITCDALLAMAAMTDIDAEQAREDRAAFKAAG